METVHLSDKFGTHLLDHLDFYQSKYLKYCDEMPESRNRRVIS
jgi:hypothetical protein